MSSGGKGSAASGRLVLVNLLCGKPECSRFETRWLGQARTACNKIPTLAYFLAGFKRYLIY